jgi:hypothetical protein
MGSWRRLLNEELHTLYVSPNIRAIKAKRDEMGGARTCIREMRDIYRNRLENL